MKKSDIIILIIVLILIVSYIFIKLFTIRSESYLLEYSNKKSTNIVTSIINKSISEVLLSDDYENLINVEKNDNDNITNLNFNNKKINDILNKSTTYILSNIKELESNDSLIFYVPIGIIHNIPVLVNISPKIPFKINIIGDVVSDTKINIEDYGINNSMIEIALNITMQVQIILPFKSNTISIDKKILLDNKVIQGQIPTYYGGLNYLLK